MEKLLEEPPEFHTSIVEQIKMRTLSMFDIHATLQATTQPQLELHLFFKLTVCLWKMPTGTFTEMGTDPQKKLQTDHCHFLAVASRCRLLWRLEQLAG